MQLIPCLAKLLSTPDDPYFIEHAVSAASDLEYLQRQAKNARISGLPCRVALLGLGIPAAAVAQCKQYVVQIPCEAEAGLHKLRTKLEGSTVRGLPQPLTQALDDLQV